MATKKIKNLCVASGKYTGNDGQEHTNWLTIGAILQKEDGGKFMLLERTFNPAGCPNPENRSTLIVSMFDVKPKDGEQAQSQSQESSSGMPDFKDDDIPF